MERLKYHVFQLFTERESKQMFTVSRVQSEILLQPTRWLQLQNNFQHFTLKQFSVYTVQIIPLPPFPQFVRACLPVILRPDIAFYNRMHWIFSQSDVALLLLRKINERLWHIQILVLWCNIRFWGVLKLRYWFVSWKGGCEANRVENWPIDLFDLCERIDSMANWKG